mgnify:CR=1 FL=1
MSKYIVLKDISKSFKGRRVLESVSFELERGKLLAILGPPGSGKTTLLKIISGLEKQDSGHIYIDGRLVDDVPPYERRMAMVFETLALYTHLTVYENIASPLLAEKRDRKYIDERVREIAKMLRIEHILERKADKLSGGERQRVAIARAIAKEAEIYLFDEPFANLDAKIKYSLRTEFKKLKEVLGKTIIMATSDPLDALALGDEVIIFRNGKIIQSGNPVEVYEKPINIELARYLTGKIINELPLIKDIEGNGWRTSIAEESDLELSISPNIRQQLNKFGGSIIVVSYPQSTRIDIVKGSCRGIGIKGKYIGYEYRGSDFLLYALSGNRIFSALSTTKLQAEHRSDVYICFEDMIFYESETGMLLG